MLRMRTFMPLSVIVALALCPASLPAQNRGAAGIDQVPAPGAARTGVGVTPVDPSRSSATVQNPAAEKVSAETLSACRQARAQDRPAPKGVDCLKALQVSESKQPSANAATAETSLLGMLGQNVDAGGTASSIGNGTISADQVARQLSSGDLQRTVDGDVAASVARDHPAPAPAPAPSSPR